MAEVILTIVITKVILLAVSIYFHIKKSSLRYIVPVIGLFVGLIIIGLSFIFKQISDIYGFAIFIGSAGAFLLMAIIATAQDLRQSIR